MSLPYWLFLFIRYDVVTYLCFFFLDILNVHKAFHLLDKNVLLLLVPFIFLFTILYLGSECDRRFFPQLRENLFTVYRNECCHWPAFSKTIIIFSGLTWIPHFYIFFVEQIMKIKFQLSHIYFILVNTLPVPRFTFRCSWLLSFSPSSPPFITRFNSLKCIHLTFSLSLIRLSLTYLYHSLCFFYALIHFFKFNFFALQLHQVNSPHSPNPYFDISGLQILFSCLLKLR